MKGIRLLSAGIMASVIVFGCARYKIEPPEGFAEVKRQGVGKFLAVSPEGVKLGVRTARNYPKKDIEYWQTAMTEHMTKAGYTLISGPEGFQMKKKGGVYFMWGAPYQGKDYIYMTGLIVSGRRLIIIETAGKTNVLQEYEEQILESMHNMSTW